MHKVIGAEGWGLASDGETLYVTDSGHELFHVDPKTYEVLRRMPIVDPRLGGAAGQRVHGVRQRKKRRKAGGMPHGEPLGVHVHNGGKAGPFVQREEQEWLAKKKQEVCCLLPLEAAGEQSN